MSAVYNKDLMKEITHIKVILIGDGTPEKMKESIQYRLAQVENSNGESLWKRFKKIPMGRKITIFIIGIPFLKPYWDGIFDILHGALNWVQAIPK